ncbi:hypothetical protein Y1Q_0010177 [Alligator mississippiensis]|uniref:Uncharacterized protein n=1 Tax=Alligator mississippiensis TaxID=8496 RepID=A0A151NG64_ALLMI|nr:hypothetical protein Y1Q_0010177 [Alligator mississippiensis]
MAAAHRKGEEAGSESIHLSYRGSWDKPECHMEMNAICQASQLHAPWRSFPFASQNVIFHQHQLPFL